MATSPVAPPATRPGNRQKVSQMDGPLPSSRLAPSIWKADVAAPQTNPSGTRRVGSGRGSVGAMTAQWSLASVARRRAASFSSILNEISGCSRRTGRIEIEARERVWSSSAAVTVADRGWRSIMASSPK